MFKTVACASAAIALTACAPAATRAEPAMWVVKDADSEIFLLGTVHLLRPELAWKSPRISKALAACGDLTLELADPDNAAAIAPWIRAHGFDPANPLSSRLTEAERARLAQAAATLKLAPEQLEPMRPWLAALTLSIAPLLRAGYDPQAGVDRLLMADARAKGKPVRGFETAESQVKMLAGLPEQTQLDFLRESLDDYADATVELDKLAEAWAGGRTEEIDRLVNDEVRDVHPALYRALLVDRNAGFARQIKGMLDDSSGPRCVAVGAAHLAGSDSVQAKLKAMGVKAERY